MTPFRWIGVLTALLLALWTPALAEPDSGLDSPPRAWVLLRDADFRPVLSEEHLSDLLPGDSFQGKHFKIVLGRSEDPIPRSEPDPSLRLKAATTYHHLTRARKFWVEALESEFVANLPQLTIRLEITSGFSDLGHFLNDRLGSEYNNALSIPGGTPFPGSPHPPWNPEIWFRPARKTRPREGGPNATALADSGVSAMATALRGPLEASFTSVWIRTALQGVLTPSPQGELRKSLLQQAGAFVLAEGLLRALKNGPPEFLKRPIRLDSAMVPEIIYHEFSHIALSPLLPLSRSTPLVEGMADYFASRISGHPLLATGIRRYSSVRPKNGYRNTAYRREWELPALANGDFVLSLLWRIRQEFPREADALLLDAAKSAADLGGDLRHHLLRALLDSCERICASPRADRLRLLSLFADLGF